LISQFFKQLASALKEYEDKDGKRHWITKDSAWQLLDEYADYWNITSAIPVDSLPVVPWLLFFSGLSIYI
jgi:hypothetical protein